jgi:hypothetical protein
MVNRDLRAKAASQIRGFLASEITNFEFADDFPHDKSDRALRAIERRLWLRYDDARTHHCNFLPDSPPEMLFQRCALFLDTDMEYEWPDLSFHNLAHPIVGVLTGDLFRFKRIKAAKLEGDYQVWPFFRIADFEHARNQFGQDSLRADECVEPVSGGSNRLERSVPIGFAALQTILFFAPIVFAMLGIVFGSSKWSAAAAMCFVAYLLSLGISRRIQRRVNTRQ